MKMKSRLKKQLYLLLVLLPFSSAVIAAFNWNLFWAVLATTAVVVGATLLNPALIGLAGPLYGAEAALWGAVAKVNQAGTPLSDYTTTTQAITYTMPAVPGTSNPQVQQLATTAQNAIADVFSKIEAAVTAARRYQGAINQGNPICGISPPPSGVSPLATGNAMRAASPTRSARICAAG